MPATKIETLVRRSRLRRLRRPTKILYPRAPERQYNAAVQSIVAAIEAEVTRLLLPRLRDLRSQSRKPVRSMDHLDEWGDDLDGYIEELGLWFGRTYTEEEVRRLAQVTGRSVEFWNRRELTKSISRVIDMPVFFSDAGLADEMQGWVYDNARLITKLADDTFKDIQGIVSRGITQGLPWEDIQDQIVGTGIEPGKFASVEKRAEGIARDQVGKLFGNLSEMRQTELGIEEYIWRTAQDSRVRPSHAEREGEVFRWDTPPEGGHPGQEIMCRCWSSPVIEDVR